MYTSLGEQEASAQFGSLRRIKEEIQTLTWSQLRKWATLNLFDHWFIQLIWSVITASFYFYSYIRWLIMHPAAKHEHEASLKLKRKWEDIYFWVGYKRVMHAFFNLKIY
jgi:hypothetical protein